MEQLAYYALYPRNFPYLSAFATLRTWDTALRWRRG
jgi:hypothetical protein